MSPFSGMKTVDGIEHTEESLNGFASKHLTDLFSGQYAKDHINSTFDDFYSFPKVPEITP